MPSASEPELLAVNTHAEKIRVLTFNRPQKRNALSQALMDKFLYELAIASRDARVRAIVVTGGKSFFSAGADINEIAALDAEAATRCRYLEDLCNGLRSVRKPIIAAVEGIALGGGFEVALMCDLIFASRTAQFGLPEVKIGLIPGAGGTQRLTNIMGKFKAMEMILLGSSITGEEAASCGLVAGLFEPGTVLASALEAATQIANMSRSAISLAKESICRADDKGRDDDFERHLYYYAFGTRDKREGVSAFLDKRPAKWE
ncbi:ClpP/crotonase-like domain-containing protein [Ilyonectria robusta]|uniref:ClpP/crotonase-like domain-containing protein n=1 Tax=Ilyonectria robusta TaxID=1079257 RepID=UPI001E8CB1E9|nr:ClpP/crotonase-like domain-containing protein [Ilyonectria robusta]KAH8648240.1 ClpP/crotonase-like domain-containing protein [Ilyonectria robusta]